MTLQVSDDDFVVVGARQKVVGTGGETDGADIAVVRAVCLHHAAPLDVVQHAAAVLLARR